MAGKKQHELEKDDTLTEANMSDPAQDAQNSVEDTHETEPLLHATDNPSPQPQIKPVSHGRLKAFLQTRWGLSLAIAGCSIVVLAILYAIPLTRYGILGLVLKKDVTVTIKDNSTGKPVSQADVSLAGKTMKSDSGGHATFRNVPVGDYTVMIGKKYYSAAKQTLTVPVFTAPAEPTISFKATGRQVPVVILDKISNKPVDKALITASDTAATTDAKGEATIVLPANKASVDATIKLDGYNQRTVTLTVTEQKDAKNSFALTASGQIYFLSKRSGTVDVMKADLDGGNASVVLKGTGKESDTETLLLASRDWKYLALLARRDGTNTNLYLITTATGALSTIDEANSKASLTSIGWSNDNFVYKVDRDKAINNQYSQTALKIFNPGANKISVIDQTDAQKHDDYTFFSSNFSSPTIIKDAIVYVKYWTREGYYLSSSYLSGKNMTFMKVNADGTSPQTLKTLSSVDYQSVSSRAYKPNEVDYQLFGFDTSGSAKPYAYYEYDDGKVQTTTDFNDDTFYNATYPTYLISPSGKQTFWYESRDGKDAIFLGDADAKNPKQIASFDSYTPFGWYSDDYLLFSKNGSELYIAPAATLNGEQSLTKVTDYHKPIYNIPGYGGGYGGL